MALVDWFRCSQNIHELGEEYRTLKKITTVLLHRAKTNSKGETLHAKKLRIQNKYVQNFVAKN